MLKLRSTATTGGLVLTDLAEEVRGSFEVILRDEQHLARVTTFLQVRKEQTLRQVAGFLRGVEQACRDCAEHGKKLIEDKLSFWKTWRLIWSRAQWQHDFQHEVETKLRETVQPQVENAVQLLETDLRSLWPQLQDTIEAQFASEGRNRVSKTIPDFARQRRELLQSIELTLVERIAGKGVEEQLGAYVRGKRRLAASGCRGRRGGRNCHRRRRHDQRLRRRCDRHRRHVRPRPRNVRRVRPTAEGFERLRKGNGNKAGGADRTRSSSRWSTRSILFYKEISTAFQPLAVFCTTERERYEPLVNRVEELKQTFSGLKGAPRPRRVAM